MSNTTMSNTTMSNTTMSNTAISNTSKPDPALDFQALHEIAEAAEAKLPGKIWDYIVGGTETETTLRRNRFAIDSVALRPRVLRDVSKIDATHRIFGRTSRLPLFLAPVGGLESIHPGGAAEAARAATRFGVPIMVSSVTGPPLEDTAKASADGHRLFQLYVRGDDTFVDDYVKRATAAGFNEFCITVDTQAYSRRERDITRRFVKTWRTWATGTSFQAAFNWSHIARFKDKHPRVPLILKGISTGEDAELACQHGVDVVYVSNHGGRQLDHGRGSLDVLPEVVQAVRGRAKVYVDGSFTRGTDFLKAIALGADAVGVGRLYCLGLAAGGADALVRLLEILEEEIITDLALLGCTSFGEVTRSHLHYVTPTYQPNMASAMPLKDLYKDKREGESR
jgi:isopentenyl diphosphate isomerase/L-lactate dehydrogenase-like FMN-dependent dehydrogenase